MKKAYNEQGKIINILESNEHDKYYCPVCKELLSRKFGLQNQFYAHPKGKGLDCDLKLEIKLKEEVTRTQSETSNILQDFYNKKFDDVKIELSDYKSNDGYYLTQQQKDIIMSTENRVVISALAGCVDADTEYFNGSEWVKISQYKDWDKVLQFNKNWKAELISPKRYIKSECDKLTKFETKYGVDMVLSDEHKVVYIDTSHNKNNYWKNVNLLTLSSNEMKQRQINNKTGFTGKFITTFDYDGIESYNTGLTENELRLMIAVMADGSFNSNSNWCRFNIKKDYKKERIKYLLLQCNINFKENKWNTKDDKYRSYSFYAPMREKHFPKEWYKINSTERKIILDEVYKWDGDNGHGNRSKKFRTTNKDDADFIQFLLSCDGKRATINVSDRIGEIRELNGKEYTRTSILYTVSYNGQNRNNLVSIGQQSKIENKNAVVSDYKTTDGFKYCFEVESGMLILRRNNKIFVTGNSAKSSTLYYYAKERPFRRFIYIVYNKSQKDEADLTIGKLKNVEVKTVHGLAYKYVGKLYQSKLTFNYGVIDIIKDLRLDWNRDMQLASQIKEFMTEFMLSDCKTFGELDILENLKPHERKIIISNCEKLWNLKKEYKNNVKVEHDFYLKLFQLGEVDLSNTYDGLLLDESQDSSLLTLSVVLNSNIENIVIVGDMYQSLYKWRKSVNIMSLLKDSIEYKLTTSFRVSQNIAELSNMIVKTMIGDSINMSGFNAKQTIVDSVDRNESYAILCRTNAMILGEVIDNSDKKIYYNGGFKGYNFNNIKDAYYFSVGKSTKNPLFTKFKNYREMIDYAELVKDLELLSIDKVLQKYGSRIPNIVDNLEKNSTTDSNNCDIWISTVHKSKGSTIKLPLVISNDHYDICNYESDKADTRKEIDFFSECCIIYVAITRASGQIELSDSLKMYLLNKLGDE